MIRIPPIVSIHPAAVSAKNGRLESAEHRDVELLQAVRQEHERRDDAQDGEQQVRIRSEEFFHGSFCGRQDNPTPARTVDVPRRFP